MSQGSVIVATVAEIKLQIDPNLGIMNSNLDYFH